MEFFKETCGTLPTIMDCYNLQEVTTLIDLYSKIIIKFQEHSKVFQYQGKMNSYGNSFVSSNLMNIIIINIKRLISRCCLYVHGCVLQLQVYCRLLICWCSKGKRSYSIVLTFKLVTPFS
jgi:hypothetical protein